MNLSETAFLSLMAGIILILLVCVVLAAKYAINQLKPTQDERNSESNCRKV